MFNPIRLALQGCELKVIKGLFGIFKRYKYITSLQETQPDKPCLPII